MWVRVDVFMRARRLNSGVHSPWVGAGAGAMPEACDGEKVNPVAKLPGYIFLVCPAASPCPAVVGQRPCLVARDASRIDPGSARFGRPDLLSAAWRAGRPSPGPSPGPRGPTALPRGPCPPGLALGLALGRPRRCPSTQPFRNTGRRFSARTNKGKGSLWRGRGPCLVVAHPSPPHTAPLSCKGLNRPRTRAG